MKKLLPLIIALAAPPAALAQPDDPPEDGGASPREAEDAAIAEARELFREGNLHYAAGRYTLAAERFERAYELTGAPALLFNLGNTYERAGDYERAADYLRRYLGSNKVHDVVSVRARIDRLEHAIAEKKRRASEEAVVETPPAAPAPVTRGQLPPAADRIARDPQPSKWPYAVAGAGVLAGAAVAVSFGVLAGNARDEVDSMCREGDAGGLICLPGAEPSLDRERRLALVSDIGTAVAAGSAVVAVIHFLSTRSSGERDRPAGRVTFSPTSAGGGIGITAAGRF